MSYYVCSVCGGQWQNMHTCPGGAILSTSAAKIPPVPNDPGTVCVRLDGLADKIAAWVNHNLTWSNLLGDDKRTDDQFAESLIDLLQSLAVQR